MEKITKLNAWVSVAAILIAVAYATVWLCWLLGIREFDVPVGVVLGALLGVSLRKLPEKQIVRIGIVAVLITFALRQVELY